MSAGDKDLVLDCVDVLFAPAVDVVTDHSRDPQQLRQTQVLVEVVHTVFTFAFALSEAGVVGKLLLRVKECLSAGALNGLRRHGGHLGRGAFRNAALAAG